MTSPPDDDLSNPRRAVCCWGMLPTPFAAGGGELDVISLRRVASAYLRDGCDGLVVLGVVGEPATLSDHEKQSVVREVAALGAPVSAASVVGTPDAVLADLEQAILPIRVALVSVMVPVLHCCPIALARWLTEVHRVVHLPVVVQDLPRHSGVSIAVDDLADALTGLPFVVGVKCEAPPTYERIARLASRGVPGLMSGFGGLGLVADLASGASSVAIGVTVPAAVVAAARSWSAGEDAAARQHIGQMAARIDFETQQGPSIAVRKEHLRREGLLNDASVRAPTLAWHSGLAVGSAAVGVHPSPAT